MGSLDRQRWDALWQRLGGNPPADAFDALLAAYGGADRHYHSDRHILACLEHFDRWRQLARRPDLVELALWTHAAPAPVYARYEADVRAEYAWVPEPLFRAGRGKLLRQLLEQPALYHCEPLRQRWEAAARANLRGALERLEQPA